MAIVQCSVNFTTKSHLPKDEISNTFVFAGTATPAQQVDRCQPLVEAFYNVGLGDSNPLSNSMAGYIDRLTKVMVKWYLVAATSTTVPDTHTPPGLGSPFDRREFTLGPWGTPAAGDLPPQIAAVVSFHGNMIGTREHSGHGARTAERRRGRLFIGPLDASNRAVDPATGAPVLSPGLLKTLQRNCIALAEIPGDQNVLWCVHSRVDNTVYPVIGGYVDNRFDTQRRRAEAATFRQIWDTTYAADSGLPA